MKKYLSILFVTLTILLVGPNYVLAESNIQEQSENQINLEAPTLYNGMGSINIQQTSFLTIRAEGAYAESTEQIDGYEIYLKTSKGYTLVGSNETFEDIKVVTDIGKKETYVARVYAYNLDNKKVYSDYSNEIVIDNSKVKTPFLYNGMGYVEVDQHSFLTIRAEGAYAESTEQIHGYEIYLKTSKGYKLVGSNETFEEIEVITKLGKKETYVARAYAYNLDNKKVYSSYSNTVVIDNTLDVPSFTISNSYYKSLKLTWTHNDWMVTGYKIYRATSKNGKYSYVATVKTTDIETGQILTYTDTKRTFNKTYYYKIRPYHKTESGIVYNGSYSEVKSKKVVTPAPTVEGANLSFLKNKLTWKKVTGASGYAIYKLVDGKYVYQKSITSLSYTDSLKNSKTKLELTNSYKVRAYRIVSGKKIYGPYSQAITLDSKITTPKLTYTSIDHTSYKIIGNSISGATGLELYSCADEICAEEGRALVVSEAKLDEIIAVNSMADKQYFVVRAVRTINGKSVYSDFSQVYTFSAIPKKVDITDEENYGLEVNSKTSTIFAINNTSSTTSFEIYRSSSKDGQYIKEDSIECMTYLEYIVALMEAFGITPTEEQIEEYKNELGDLQYSYICGDIGVKPGETYYYKIRTVMEENGVKYYSEYSDVDSIKIRPVQIENLTLSPNTYNSTRVEWDLLSDADGYEVYRATSKTGKYVKIGTTAGDVNLYKNTGLALNKRYYYKVRAYYLDENGNKVYGLFSDIKSRYVKALTPLYNDNVILDGSYGSLEIKSSSSSSIKSTTKNYVTLYFKMNFAKSDCTRKNIEYFKVQFYDVDGNVVSTKTLSVTLPKGTKKNFSKTYTIKLPKEAVYYDIVTI